MFSKFLKKAHIAVAAVLVFAVVVPVITVVAVQSTRARPLNIIMMVPDGMSLNAMALANLMLPDNPEAEPEEWTFEQRDGQLAIEDHFQALVRTQWAGGPITDSAPAATAMATGHKSNNYRIGLDRYDNPMANVLQAAQARGMSTGMVATSEFMHATPAAFAAHDAGRFNYEILGHQILANELNLVFSTGSAQMRSFNIYEQGVKPFVIDANKGAVPTTVSGQSEFLPNGDRNPARYSGGHRDANNIPIDFQGNQIRWSSGSQRWSRILNHNTFTQHVAQEGYEVVRTRAQMNRLAIPTSSNAADLRVWGDFNGGLTMLGQDHRYLSYDIDRQFRPDLDEPSLVDMTQRAIDLLSTNRNGFFLMVEGSKIDWAAHAHDSVALVSEILAFDRAFQVALDFAKRCGNTIVMSASDHPTGGLTIGTSDLSFSFVEGLLPSAPWTFDEAPFSFLDPLRIAIKSGEVGTTERAIQKFVICPAGQAAGGLNHDEVMRAYGIDPGHWSTFTGLLNSNFLRTRAQLIALGRDPNLSFEYLDQPVRRGEYCSETGEWLQCPQTVRVHRLIRDFRIGAHIPVDRSNPNGIVTGMQSLSTAHLQNAQRALAAIMNQINYVGFSMDWHEGGYVAFSMFAPRGFSHEELLGRSNRIIDNTDIARIMERALQANLEQLTEELFVEIFNNGDSKIDGITVSINEANSRFQSNVSSEFEMDFNNRSSWFAVEFEIAKGDRTITVVSNTNHFYINGERVRYSLGVNVYIIVEEQYTWNPQGTRNPNSHATGANIGTGRLFVPQELIRALG
ncbi:MAG: alkaline phosphatase [Firmicutes bacterium]|nr:alkaline phosphatase [Bacillota bacterium]